MYKLLKQDLSTNVKKLKNFVLSNLYDLTNDKNEGILLKEKFYDENYDEKKIFRQTKSVILLTKLFSFNKKLVKYFKTWHKFILSESVQEILYILDNVKGEIDLLKIKNMFQIFNKQNALNNIQFKETTILSKL